MRLFYYHRRNCAGGFASFKVGFLFGTAQFALWSAAFKRLAVRLALLVRLADTRFAPEFFCANLFLPNCLRMFPLYWGLLGGRCCIALAQIVPGVRFRLRFASSRGLLQTWVITISSESSAGSLFGNGSGKFIGPPAGISNNVVVAYDPDRTNFFLVI